jgi:hypothetical protein
VLAGLVGVVTACGGPSGSRFTDAPASYLLRLNQLASPDFSVDKPAVAISALTLAGGDQTAANQLPNDDLRAAASVSYARTVDFATSNGPIEVISTVARFARDGGAHSWFNADTARRDAQSGEVAMSTGPLGDEAHASSLIATTSGGMQAVQITLQWRVANVVALLQVRGRYGGTRLDDALALAHKQTSAQLR